MNIWLTNNIIMTEYCKQMAPTCNKQMNVTTLCMHGYPINFILDYCIAAAPYPTRIIGVQIAELQLKQPYLG